MRGLFEHMTPADLFLLGEIPFPLFNDVLLKQIDENKKQQKKLEEMKNKQQAPPRRKR